MIETRYMTHERLVECSFTTDGTVLLRHAKYNLLANFLERSIMCVVDFHEVDHHHPWGERTDESSVHVGTKSFSQGDVCQHGLAEPVVTC